MNASSWLKQAAREVDLLDAELILARTINKERLFLNAHPDYLLDQKERKIANARLARRIKKEPLAYILGTKDFYGRTFKVTPATLIPRPETEELIEYIKSASATSFTNNQPVRIIDVGTGSGCIAITLALELPNAQVTAVDISEDALDCAKYNACQHGVSNISMKKSDLLQNTQLSGQKFNFIVANLPYVDPEWEWLDKDTLAYEPQTALYASDHGLALIKELIISAPYYLAKNGQLVLEADQSQHQAIIDFAAQTTALKPIAQTGLALVLR